MPISLNTNIASLLTQRNLGETDKILHRVYERLSSGLRINSGKDDAAGLAISTRLTSIINGMEVASRNANDGISMSQTAEGTMTSIADSLQRVRDLTLQAQNSTNSASDIDSIQSEVNQLMEEINRVTKQTEFNGIKMLDNRTNAAVSFEFQVGTKDGEKISIGFGASSGWNLATASDSGASGVKLNTYIPTEEDKINGTARTVQAVGFDVIHGLVDENGSASGKTPLANIDAALEAVNAQRSLLGVSQNRFQTTINNLANASINMADARSRILDTDYAAETSRKASLEIRSQSGIATLGNANMKAQNVLKLLG